MGDVYMLNGKILSGLPNHAKDIEFDNTETDLSSTNAEDAIKEVNSNLSENVIGSAVTLVLNDTYTTTANGYLHLTSSPSTGVVSVNISDANNTTIGIQNLINTTGSTMESNVYLKKGMKLTPYYLTNGTAKFIPFV